MNGIITLYNRGLNFIAVQQADKFLHRIDVDSCTLSIEFLRLLQLFGFPKAIRIPYYIIDVGCDFMLRIAASIGNQLCNVLSAFFSKATCQNKALSFHPQSVLLFFIHG